MYKYVFLLLLLLMSTGTAWAVETSPGFDFSGIQNLLSEYWYGILLAIIGFFSVLATLLPAPAPDSSVIYQAIYKLCQWCAANIGHAKNHQDVKPRYLR